MGNPCCGQPTDGTDCECEWDCTCRCRTCECIAWEAQAKILASAINGAKA